MPQVPALISNSQADHAARRLREILGVTPSKLAAMTPDKAEATMFDLGECFDKISTYRNMHEYPLRKVTMGVRVMIENELRVGQPPRPAQRFKRMPRIIQKLIRFPHMRLSQMEDIGGCRAVLGTLEDLRRVQRRIHRRWPHAQVADYIAEPKSDGYRALHIIERRDGRLIEVQLRTTRQQQWAESIETWSVLMPWDLKDGAGPADLRRYFAMAAERLALDDQGADPNPVLEARFANVREEIRHYFQAATEPR